MEQLTYVEPGVVRWENVPDPRLTRATDAIVEPLAVARCDLDSMLVKAGLFPGPFPVGHEMAARVVEIGEGVLHHQTGDVVIVPFQVSCGTCSFCSRHRYAACSTYPAPVGASFGFGAAGGGFGGALADLVRVPHADHLLVAAPPGLSPASLSLLSDNVADGVRAVVPALIDQPGADVLIVAAFPGSVALYAVAAAVAAGAGSVRYVDRDPERATIARQLGASAEVTEGPWPRRFARADVTVDVTGEPEGLSAVLRSTAPFGVCTGLAVYFDARVTLPLLDMYTAGVTFNTSRVDARRFLPLVLDLIAGGFDPGVVPATMVSWDRAPQAWLEPAIKLIVTR